MPFSPVSLQETPCSIFTASPKHNLPSPHCTLYPGRLQPYPWIQACTVNPKSAFLASSRSKTTHLSHNDSLFSYPKVISTKGKQRQRKKHTKSSFHQNLKVFSLHFLSQWQCHHLHHQSGKKCESHSYFNFISLTLLSRWTPSSISSSLTVSWLSPSPLNTHCPHCHPCPHLFLPGFFQLPPDSSVSITAHLWHL